MQKSPKGRSSVDQLFRMYYYRVNHDRAHRSSEPPSYPATPKPSVSMHPTTRETSELTNLLKLATNKPYTNSSGLGGTVGKNLLPKETKRRKGC